MQRCAQTYITVWKLNSGDEKIAIICKKYDGSAESKNYISEWRNKALKWKIQWELGKES